MPDKRLQALCELGQQLLMETRYLEAARTLAEAEHQAWASRDFDTLSRLYLPLQEARRQIRQRCGEGGVSLHCFPKSPVEIIQPELVVQNCPTGQLLTGGWGTIQPAIEVRQLAVAKGLYLETFLSAVYPVIDSEAVVVIVPWEGWQLPPVRLRTLAELRLLTNHGLVLTQSEIPSDASKGTAETFANVMALWERLHQPLLEAATREPDSVQRMQAYRGVLRADPACELAHQFLADIARNLARRAAD
jgi:hypothetical protein